jgi:hypothetical protein
MQNKKMKWAGAMAGLLLAAQGYAANWTPAQLGSTTLKNWYDAADVGTLFLDAGGTAPVNGDWQNVERWNDKSGNNNYLTQKNWPPTYRTSVMNALPVVRFGGNIMASTSASMGNANDNFTVIGVFKVTSNNGWDNWVNWGPSSGYSAQTFVTSGNRPSGPAQAMEFFTGGVYGETADTAVTGQDAFLFAGAVDQAVNPIVNSVWLNGTFEGSRNPDVPYTPSTSPVTHIDFGINGQTPHGDYSEVLVLNTGTGNLSQADREKIEGYLAHKWWGAGAANPLPESHPFKAAAPVAYTVTASAGLGGTISPSGAVSVMQGQSQSFNIATNAGFSLADVLVDEVSVGAVTNYTFTDVQTNHTIAASFEAHIPTYTITASAGAGGTISPNGAIVVVQGYNQTFTISPSNAFTIADVLVDEVSVGAVTSYTFTDVQTAHTIAASFAAIPLPAVPSGLAATPAEGSVALSWSAASGAASYKVKRATASGGAYTTLTNTVSTSFADLLVYNGTTYYYVVAAVNVAGDSADSGEVSAKPQLNADLWRPSALDSGTVKNWYDAADLATLWQNGDGTGPVTANGQSINRWNDKSGNNNHLTGGNGGPAYRTSVMNALPVLQFNNQYMENTTSVSMGNPTDNVTVIGVFKKPVNNDWTPFVQWGKYPLNGAGDRVVFATGGSRLEPVPGETGSAEFAYMGGFGSWTTQSVTSETTPFMFIGALDQVPSPDTFTVWKDGLLQYGARDASATTSPSDILDAIRVGCYPWPLRADISELIILNTGTGSLSQSDRQRVEGYLAHKWWGAGAANPLPSDHRFKNLAPKLFSKGTLIGFY